ncbi:MAG TPA: DUF1579 domain-containing protein [Verrucomicrobiae bacterium]|jgi:hypothetical protein
MKNCQLPAYLTAAGLALALSTACMAQDNQSPKPDTKSNVDTAQMMAAMAELAKPGENHKLLETTTGSWTYKMKWWTAPDGPPMEVSGTSTTKSLMDGRYFVSEHASKMPMPGPDGKMMDMDFKGMSTEGYDNVKKKFVASWIDNMGTGIMLMEGTYDAASKKLTYLGEEEPMPGMKMKVRQTIIFTDKDHRVMEYYELRGTGEVKVMAIEYNRTN